MTVDAAHHQPQRPALTPAREPLAPPPDLQAIRARLTELVTAEFDREWDVVLEEAKASKDLSGVHDLLAKCHDVRSLRNPCNPHMGV